MSLRSPALDFEEDYVNLKEETVEMNLEGLYQLYCTNIYRNYLNTLTIFHLVITCVHSTIIGTIRRNQKKHKYEVYINLLGAALSMLSLRPYMRVKFEKEHPSVKYLVSWASLLIMAAPDLCINIYNLGVNKEMERPLYAGYVITVAYLFMPVPGLVHSFLLGITVTILYCTNIIFITTSYEKDRSEYAAMLTPDIIYLIGLNFIGVFVRWRRGVLRRIAFLTKRNHVEQTLICKYAKGQEQDLLVSIIPEQMAAQISKDIATRIKSSTAASTSFSSISRISLHLKDIDRAISRKLFIEPHDDVSILFADVVNYTYLTTKVDVKTLVSILHDLFQRFDTACEKFSIMRIKFLGDCYYCVSGMPVSHPLHGVCCVEMGLAIIQHVREVRSLRDVNIDMRVGIHSGNLFAGIIGTTKWQYDVWSKDVDIANRLEQTGSPGRVHITDATLNLIDDYYTYETGSERAQVDPILVKYNIKTYFIIERSEDMDTSREWANYLKSKEETDQRVSYNNQHNVVYSEIVDKSNELMIKEIESLPICRTHCYESCFIRQPRVTSDHMDEYHARHSISKICLLFNSYQNELQYMSSVSNQALRWPTVLGFLILICVIISQTVNKVIQDVQSYLTLTGVLLGINLALVIVLWRFVLFRKCIKSYRFKVPYQFYDLKKRNKNISKKIITIYVTIYVTILLSILLATFTHMILCDEQALENDMNTIFRLLEDGIRVLCLNSWSITNCVVLYLAVALSWPHIPFFAMLLSTGSVLIAYLWMIFNNLSLTFESSVMTHIGVSAEYSHIWTVLTLYFLYILNCRHMIFLTKYNFFTKNQLERKIQHSKLANETIRILLNNIFPSHVVQMYLTRSQTNEPFYEKHNNVAVMFATIIHNSDISKDLRLMNEIWCEFDEILSSYKYPIKVEKIKVANWTYMAACGFTIKKEHFDSKSAIMMRPNQNISSHRRSVSWRLRNTRVRDPKRSIFLIDTDIDDDESDTSSHQGEPSSEDRMSKRDMLIVHIITSFALDLLKVVRDFNKILQHTRDLDEAPITLRVGITSGEVMAGIVGASVAHYDIWGDAVNMASRMDSTGIPGRIQLNEMDAEILRSFNVECSYRGKTFIKGRGEMPTYFVETDENLDFKRIN